MCPTLKKWEPKAGQYLWDCNASNGFFGFRPFSSGKVQFDDGPLAGKEHSLEFEMEEWFKPRYELFVPRYPNARFHIPAAKVQMIPDGEFSSKAEVFLKIFRYCDGNDVDGFRLRFSASDDVSRELRLRSDLYVVRLILTLELEKKPEAAVVKDLTQAQTDVPSASVPIEEKTVFSEILFRKASDVKILCGKEEFHAHKDLLAEKSPVFRQMFENEMTEALTGQVVLDEKEIAPSSVLQLLRFLYTGKMESKEVCRDLFVAGEKYDMQGLKKHCENYLVKTIKQDDAAELYDLAETHNGVLLKAKTLDLLKLHKMNLFPNADAFQVFAMKYPQLVFQLFKN